MPYYYFFENNFSAFNIFKNGLWFCIWFYCNVSTGFCFLYQSAYDTWCFLNLQIEVSLFSLSGAYFIVLFTISLRLLHYFLYFSIPSSLWYSFWIFPARLGLHSINSLFSHVLLHYHFLFFFSVPEFVWFLF